MKWGLTKNNQSNTSLDTFKSGIDRFFDDFFSLQPSGFFQTDWMPEISVEDEKNSIKIRAEIPGIDEKDINVTLENNFLTISGEKKEETSKKDKNNNYSYSERRFGSFSRTISLPEGIKTDKINAKYKNGVLNIEIQKDETKQPEKIEIKVN